MFKPLEMVKVTLQVLRSDVAKVTHVIAKQGLLHLLDSQKFIRQVGKVSDEEFQALMNRFTNLEQTVTTLCTDLSIGRKIRKDIEVEPEQEIDDLENAVKQIQKDLNVPSEQLKRIEQQREEKTQRLELLQSISEAGPDLQTVQKFSYFYKAVGFIATKDIHRLEASLASIRAIFVPLTTIGNRSLIVVLCSQKEQETLNRALTSAYFERIELPDLGSENIYETITRLETEITQLTEKKAQLNQELRNTQADAVEKLQTLREKILLALLILKAQQHYGKSSRSYIIMGWVPKSAVRDLQDEVIRVTQGRVQIEVSAPELVEEVQQGLIKIPILFNNPYLIRPFETVVFNYGTVAYKELDPTPIVALSFLVMFGMMFGDIGHGLVLFLIGYWLFKKFYQFMDYGIIVMECGVSSAIFGILYGSIFGVEHWLPALWLHPAEKINQFMTFAIGFGVVMISLGVILNIVNSFQRKDYESGVLGHYGIVGGVFYWICVGLGLKYAIQGHLGLSTTTLIILLAVPLGVIFFREPLGHVFFKKHDTEEKIFPSGIGLFIMEAVIDIMDVVIRYLGNTVSFIRTAAFALAHGGLFIAVFSLADILGQLKGGGLWYWIVIVLGNVVIIALEGLVVSIQTIRLEYYEFFSKFFKGGGEKFAPLTIE
jgi:V/A-type H+-transporting ATPase subunit I